MKTLISIFAVTLALAFTRSSVRGGRRFCCNTVEADCVKAGGTWDATTKMCAEKKP